MAEDESYRWRDLPKEQYPWSSPKLSPVFAKVASCRGHWCFYLKTKTIFSLKMGGNHFIQILHFCSLRCPVPRYLCPCYTSLLISQPLQFISSSFNYKFFAHTSLCSYRTLLTYASKNYQSPRLQGRIVGEGEFSRQSCPRLQPITFRYVSHASL